MVSRRKFNGKQVFRIMQAHRYKRHGNCDGHPDPGGRRLGAYAAPFGCEPSGRWHRLLHSDATPIPVSQEFHAYRGDVRVNRKGLTRCVRERGVCRCSGLVAAKTGGNRFTKTYGTLGFCPQQGQFVLCMFERRELAALISRS